VEVLANSCFAKCPLCEVTFEKKSKLKTIEEFVFHDTKLQKLEIPASCEVADVSCVLEVASVTVAKESRFLAMEDSFFMTYGRKRLIKYIGSGSVFLIAKETEIIDRCCFY
jgi:hypothetical protein